MRSAGDAAPGAGGETLIAATVEPSWSVVSVIRERVAQVLAAFPAELRAAATVTASELVENAVKYGDPAPIQFAMTLTQGTLSIRTVSGCADQAGLTKLSERIREIQCSRDKEALYLARLETLLACASESHRLGLYRIAFEGKFELACACDNQTVTVTATRDLP